MKAGKTNPRIRLLNKQMRGTSKLRLFDVRPLLPTLFCKERLRGFFSSQQSYLANFFQRRKEKVFSFTAIIQYTASVILVQNQKANKKKPRRNSSCWWFRRIKNPPFWNGFNHAVATWPFLYHGFPTWPLYHHCWSHVAAVSSWLFHVAELHFMAAPRGKTACHSCPTWQNCMS